MRSSSYQKRLNTKIPRWQKASPEVSMPAGAFIQREHPLEALYEKNRKQKDILKLILHGETVEAIAARLNVSKYEVRRVVALLINLLGVKKIENINDEIIIIFIDEMGVGVRSKYLASALVCNHIVSYIATGWNFLILKSAPTAVRDTIGGVKGKKVLVITDDYEAYADAVFTVFPDAIHEGNSTASGVSYMFTLLIMDVRGRSL